MKALMFGPSMKPSMTYVNWVWMEPFDYIAVGDIVCFERRGKLGRLVHRVIDIDVSGRLYIKGDNALKVDCVGLSEVFFKVTKFKNII